MHTEGSDVDLTDNYNHQTLCEWLATDLGLLRDEITPKMLAWMPTQRSHAVQALAAVASGETKSIGLSLLPQTYHSSVQAWTSSHHFVAPLRLELHIYRHI